MGRYFSKQSKFRGFWIRLNQWILLNPFQTAPPDTVLAGPAYRVPSPRCLAHPSPSHTPPLTLGPRLVPAPPVSRGPSLSPVAWQRHNPRLTVGGHCWLPHVADRHAQGPLSSFSRCHALAPAWPLSFFTSLPRATEALEKPPATTHSLFSPFSSRPCSSSSSPPFSIAYASASPAPTTGDPSSSPVPIWEPPPPSLHDEALPSATIVPNWGRPHLPSSTPTLQGHTSIAIGHWSSLPADERCCPETSPPPPRRTVIRVSSAPDRLARHPLGGPHELTGSTLPPARHHRAIGEHASIVARTNYVRWSCPVRAPCSRVVSHFLGWTGPPGQGPASLSVGCVWQAAMLRGL
jgi:hypothetical protein